MLDALSNILNAVGTGSPPRNLDQKAVGAFWNKEVPGVLPYIRHLIDFATSGGYATPLGFARLVSIVPEETHLDIHVAIENDRFPNVSSENILRIPYPNLAIQKLCQGQSAQFGKLEVRHTGSLLPRISRQDDTVHILWDQPIEAHLANDSWAKRLWLSMSRFEILGISLTATSGDIVARGLKDRLLPNLIWK